ncbi:MAG: SusC/RagA family TonB-linked outer membrane protein, partial [Prolixibacteraceae bacterium]|nr:SusC/RagA family TonB-linked outer membrane protein [Prolixibacteraceae bacterium]
MEKLTYGKRLHFHDNLLFKLVIIIKMCIVCLFFTTGSVYAVPDDMTANQQNIITGKVTDGSTGEPLIGVSVVVKGTTIGITTNTVGEFTFSVPERQVTLTLSYIGYLSQEVRAVAGQFVSVQLIEDIQEIEQVVVVGYGMQKKESVVGAITQVENETLVQSGLTNITNAIAGKLSGVLTIQQTGEPGADKSEIIIRGLSSWNSSAPLTLVDGVERDFSNLDPNEINTISVLKDASATAVFGARGANGVIIVTTKRGSLGKPKFDFSATVGGDRATRIPDHISSHTTMSMLNVALMNQQSFTSLVSDEVLEEYRNPSTPLNALRYPNVNWFEELTTSFAPTSNANLNVQGGTNFVKYFCSLGYAHQGSFFKNYNEGYLDSRYKNDRFNYRGNVDFSLTKSTLLSLNLGGDINIKNQPTTGGTWGIWGGLYGTSPSRFPAYFPAWMLEEYPDPDYPDDSGIRLAYSLHELRGNPY